MDRDNTNADAPEFDLEALQGPRTLPVSTLRELPHAHKCRVCRTPFRSKKARDGYCPSCRQIIEDRTGELDTVLCRVEHSGVAVRQKAIEQVRRSLTCNVVTIGWNVACGWEGNAARGWPRTIASFRAVLRTYVERHQRHLWQEHCSPGRFGWAARKRERKQFHRLCRLPEDQQPEFIKQHLKTVRWFKEQGINVTVQWPEDD